MNPFNYDFNHDGKLDKEDEYLFYEITEVDDSGTLPARRVFAQAVGSR